MFLLAISSLVLSSCAAVRDGAGSGLSKSTYAATTPVVGKEFLLKYFSTEEVDDECTNDVCTCSDDDETWYIQQGRVSISSSSSNGYGAGVSSGFGMHMVNLTNRLTTGGNSVQEVEAYFAEKFDNMMTTQVLDSFMDYNIGLYTSDLDSLVSTFESDSIDYFSMTWDSDSTTWYSVIVLVPTSHMVLEVMSESSSILAQRKASLYKSKSRLSPRVVTSVLDSFTGSNSTTKAGSSSSTSTVSVIRVNRAASDLTVIDTFYQDVMGATLDIEESDDDVSRYCYLYSGATVELCFSKRDDSATYGDFKVSSMEDQLNAVHANLLAKPTCGTDKWLDNHHAYDSMSYSATDLVTYLDSDASSTYYYCEPSSSFFSTTYSLHYVIDPTGWGIQLDVQISSSPSGCSASADAEELVGSTYNPACDLGSC